MFLMKPGSIELRTVVKERLIPHIHSRGFQLDAREIHKHDPYGHLMRRFLRWDGNRLELLDIQFDKHGRAKFVFNLGVAPPEGVDDYLGHHSQLETDISNILKHGRLYAGNPYFMRWFSIPLLRIPLIRSPSAEDIVQHAIQLFPQAEAWLRDGTVGPNIRVQMGIAGTSAKAEHTPISNFKRIHLE
jgi:hypothetical protein